MKKVFADTGYWIALLNPYDDLHNQAKKLSQSLKSATIVTSQMVLAELLNEFSKRGENFRKITTQFIEQLAQKSNIIIVAQNDQQFQDGLELYKQRPDKQWSLTDCVSFIIMKEMDISEALAYDKHFEQAGFIALLRNN
ncbi:PIN domain-containing protein [Cyanobacterium aponinum UTEX 3222]|uniref:type II toxin-antitoxin system VapC family toxin n=1 Tax=Cyanobacterium aponinum TaxID=379064 RepID=UPI002B4BC2EA|nr:PIN domain-containing protein [Cyanobacterium aponinum]WRL37987.1 PIN domain-containing protein [Cyanobacterium aponinum UTEX 3221]WRL41533.1 PIN domain-containing protein [Cyanobacterium aponinum UTEX 3222]